MPHTRAPDSRLQINVFVAGGIGQLAISGFNYIIKNQFVTGRPDNVFHSLKDTFPDNEYLTSLTITEGRLK